MAEEYIRKSSIDYGYYPIAPILKGGSIVWKYIAFMDEINAMPPADVVKVVRCKDCKWFGKIGCAIEVVDETDMPKENDFCSFAERKTMRLIDADALWKEFCRSEAIEERYGSGVLEIAGNIIDNAPTVDAVPQWIPCEERLPELDEICLVTEKDGSIRHCYFDSADPVLFATVEEGMYVRNVVAWMPLPEPYKEEQHG